MSRFWTAQVLRAGALGLLLIATTARADLAPGDAQFKTHASVPQLPKYTAGTPAYFLPANVFASNVANLDGDFSGTVTTTVYLNPNTNTLTFSYVFALDGANTAPLIRATLGGVWDGIGISATGADTSGTSGGLDAAPEWADGSPLFIERDSGPGATPAIQWRSAGVGTTIGPNNTSANIWFETDATSITRSRVGLLDGGATGQGAILTPVPAPAAIILGLIGMGSLGWIRRKA